MNTRKISMLVAAILAVLTLSNCGAGGTTTTLTTDALSDSDSSDASDSTEVQPLDGLERQDFGGKPFTILDANDYQSTYQNLPGDEITGDIVNDGLFDRGRYVEEHLGVELKYDVRTANEGYSLVKKAVQSNEHEIDILIGGLGSGMGAMATSGFFANLLDIDGLSLNEKWWSTLMNESVQYDGKLYYTSGDISPTMYCALHCTFLNNKLLDDYGLTKDYYQLVRDGDWTIDELIAIGKDRDKDVNMDGQMSAKDDFFGVACMNDLAPALASGCGVKYSVVENGEIKVDLSNEYTFDVVEHLKDLMRQIKYDDRSEIMYMFTEDRAIATVHLTASGKNWFRNMNSDFMILPLPKYNSDQDRYYSYMNTWTTAYMSIPSTADMELAGPVTEMLARYSYQKIRPQFYDLVLKQKAARDESSGEMLDLIFDSAYLDFNMIYDFGGTLSAIQQVYTQGKPLASTLAAAQDAAKAEIEKFEQDW